MTTANDIPMVEWVCPKCRQKCAAVPTVKTCRYCGELRPDLPTVRNGPTASQGGPPANDAGASHRESAEPAKTRETGLPGGSGPNSYAVPPITAAGGGCRETRHLGRNRTPLDTLNKTERRAYEQLRASGVPADCILIQPTLRLPDGTTYTPDFVVLRSDKRPLGIEVKGGPLYRRAAEQGVERFRRAAQTWPGVEWQLWHSRKGGGFDVLTP